ncbi:MAG: ribbon-helix-helix protein [Caulobacteraceae bacterium]|nr:ribbon-helix-helix protein [Caulobacteraceae bacterium]
MPTPDASTHHTRAINLRVREETRVLIDRAAKVQGRSRSDFMIEAARRAAEDAILDQAVIQLDPASYDRFLNMLENPGPPNEKLRAIMNAAPPWKA